VIECRSQEQLDEVPIAEPITLKGDAYFRLNNRKEVTARDEVTVTASDSNVVARDRASVRAYGTSRVDAHDHVRLSIHHDSQATAHDDCVTEVFDHGQVKARDRVNVDAAGDCQVISYGSGRITARGHTKVVANGCPEVFLFDSAHATMFGGTLIARERSQAEVHYQTRVWAFDASTIRAFDCKNVNATGRSVVIAYRNTHVQASSQVVIRTTSGVHTSGGVVVPMVDPTTVQEWCDYWGVVVKDGVALLYKAVYDNYKSPWGTLYLPGTTPEALDWSPEGECGAGLHFCPHPSLCRTFLENVGHYLICPVAVADMRAPDYDDIYPGKIKARRVCQPIIECDAFGIPLTGGTNG
jgi:hypothetical protein